VPLPITHGTSGGKSYLILEYLKFGARGNARLLGEQLAGLHHFTSDQPAKVQQAAEEVNSGHSRPGCCATPCHGRTSAKFGFAHDNFIGSTPQPNTWTNDWISFLREKRFGFQLQLAKQNGYGGRLQDLGAALLEKLPAFFDGYAPQPSLLHGDLWSGNHAFLTDGTPAIFDPAAYYGDREADIAMTELFGGYPGGFYAAYRAAWPLDDGYVTRSELYNLYHILNHANLFGSGYARQAEGMMQRLLAIPN
jgi:protein-ribulosamine 3-kinase